MTRNTIRATLVLFACLTLSTACVSPFSEHAVDVREAWVRKANNFHRKWDRYFLGLDWDDPYHQWHDPQYAAGPMHR